GQTDHRRQLFGLREIGFGAGGDAVRLKFDNALISVAAAARLDGDGERALSGERGEILVFKFGEALAIQPREAAQARGTTVLRAVVIDGDEIERAVAFGLHRETAV